MQKRKHIKQGMALITVLTLISLEAFLVRFLCTYDGFMTPRDFGIIAVSAVSLNLLVAFFLRLLLPFGIWQVPLWTICGLWAAWYNPNPARLQFWLTVEKLHVGMTVSEMRSTARPYNIQKTHWGYNRPANQTEWYITGYRQTYPYYDAATVITENGIVTEKSSYVDD